jgi:hypothetical protein
MDNDEIKRINYLNALNDEQILKNLENDNNYLIKSNNIQKSNNFIKNRIRYVKTPYIIRSKL